MDILSLTAVELAKAIREGKTTSVEATQAVLDKIAASEDTYHCYVTVEREKALQQAAEVQKKIEAGELTGPLAGVPFAIKDNMCTEGTLTTCSSKILENFVPTFSAEAVLNLEKAGAVILGKTNMDEFAMGSTTETSYYGVTKNPRNPEHVPGGSSGGSAAAVAAQECFAALGSDTGGSIRQPASYCGVVGMKPTYGTVSRYGLIAYGSSLDQIGPLTKDVTDCATVLEAITSHDPKDSTSMKRENTDFTSALVADVKGMKIGIPRDYFGEGLDPEVRDAVLAAAEVLKAQGAEVEEFDLSLVDYAIPTYYTIAAAESCTAGMFTARLVNVAGASDVLNESFITYANEAKMKYLGVKEETLNTVGAVSEDTARQMAEGVARQAGSNVGVGITGLAGPGGETPEKKAGLVYIGVSVNGKTKVNKYQLNGNRQKVRETAVCRALTMVRHALVEEFL